MMNNRILKLREQAGLQPYYDAQEGQIEKFAELIVGECVDIIEKLPPGYKDYRDQIEDAFRRACVKEIRQQLGVEE